MVHASPGSAASPGPGARVLANQVGYLPGGPKRATVVSDAAEPLVWRLLDGTGSVVAEGHTTPRGLDTSAGVEVHTLDATAYTGTGSGMRFEVGDDHSHPFDIGGSAYRQLRVDALSFFYPQRSGTEIVGAVAGEAYARPAGHVSRFGGDEVNQGDLAVPCLPADEAVAQYGRATMAAYGDAWPGDYHLDVVGGWYDAGDLGKYVVNGGISVYQLLSAYERSTSAPSADVEALADRTLRIPEAGNGIPDLLDEVRWELRFLLAMQVPDGEPLGGMAHHKMSDLRWVGLPMPPHEDPQPRYLHPPTTAATLNLAAVAAQGARVYRPVDAPFADMLLAAARRAWDAAEANPALYAPPPTHPDPGSGPYDDDDVSDEFYWAAAQLYLTTGEQRFLDAVVASEHHGAPAEVLFRREGFDWQHTAAAGRLDLATVPSDLPDRDRVVRSVLEGADRFLAIQAREPFGHPYSPTNGDYDWGSNHLLINNLVVVATAFDLSGERRYLDGVLEGLDYLFGRNVLGTSYVTGYGTVDVRNQHSRWYAHQLDPTSPNPPAGTLSGGPNSSTQDPVAAELVGGRPPQQCFVDDIGSWSTNELTINWNAALGWLASFVADQVERDRR